MSADSNSIRLPRRHLRRCFHCRCYLLSLRRRHLLRSIPPRCSCWCPLRGDALGVHAPVACNGYVSRGAYALDGDAIRGNAIVANALDGDGLHVHAIVAYTRLLASDNDPLGDDRHRL